MKAVFTMREGYWRSKFEPQYPMPVARLKPWKGQRKFLEALAKVEESSLPLRSMFKGWSNCRCCQCKNGSAEYSIKMSGFIVAWPDGFEHYVREHNVRPSWAFQSFIEMIAETI